MIDKSEMIFGVCVVIEVIQVGKEIDKILVKKDIQSDLLKELFIVLKGMLIFVQCVLVECINCIICKNYQGVVVFIFLVMYQKMEDLVFFFFEEGKNFFFVMFDGIMDVCNFGVIVCICECVGVDVVIIFVKGSVMVNVDVMKILVGVLYILLVCCEQNLKIIL